MRMCPLYMHAYILGTIDGFRQRQVAFPARFCCHGALQCTKIKIAKPKPNKVNLAFQNRRQVKWSWLILQPESPKYPYPSLLQAIYCFEMIYFCSVKHTANFLETISALHGCSCMILLANQHQRTQIFG